MALWQGLPTPEEFYIACAERSDVLEWDEVQARTGPEVRLRAALVRARHEVLHHPIPDRLVVGNHQVVGVSGEGHWASTYSPYDPVGVPAVLQTVLHCFDGREVSEVRSMLYEERGIAIQDELLRQLVDWGVLVDASKP